MDGDPSMALAPDLATRCDFVWKRATWALIASYLLFLTCLVLLRHGNLAWDDADYLRRGLANARLAVEGRTLPSIPRIADLLLQEGPKPPFLVAWLMLGVSIVGRTNLDALIAFGSVLPFALLALTAFVLACRSHGSGAGLLAIVLLAASPRTLLFGGKVMVETFLGLWVMLTLAWTAELLVRPCRRAGVILGLATGLALLTKLTAVLLLGGAAMVLVLRMARHAPEQRVRLGPRNVRWSRALSWPAPGTPGTCPPRSSSESSPAGSTSMWKDDRTLFIHSIGC